MRLGLSSFWKNVLTVIAGAALAQAIPMAVLLVLTRIVPANEIGDFLLLLGASNISSTIAAASLEKGIFSARGEEDVLNLLRLSLTIGCLLGLLMLATISLLPILGVSVLNQTISKYALGFVIYSVVMAFNRNLQAVCVYRSQFWLLNKAKLVLATPVAMSQLLAAMANLGTEGLFYSTVIVSAASTFLSMKWLDISWKLLLTRFYFPSLRKTFFDNYRFLLFSLPADLINSMASQLPIFIIAARFGSVAVAMYGLVLRVISIPVGLLGSSVLTVFKDRAGQDYRERGECRDIFLKTLRTLTLLSSVPFLVLCIFGSSVVTLLLGEKWAVAGEYAQLLAPLFLITFVSSPLSYVLYFSKNGQIIDLSCQFVLALVMWGAFSRSSSMHDAVMRYSIFGSAYYIGYLFLSYRAASGQNNTYLSRFK